MKCPKGVRVCPNGWVNCNLCANKKACDEGTYVAELEDHELETDLAIVIEVPVEVAVVPTVVAKSHRGTWYSNWNGMTTEERWAEIRKYRQPSLHDKTPLPLDGPTAPGGGSKSKVKKSRTGNKVFTDVWSGF